MRNTTGLALLTVALTALLAGVCPAQDAAPTQRAAQLWQSLRRAELNSPEMRDARKELETLLAELPPEQRVEVATAMMERGEDDSVNAAAINEFFGRDGLPLKDLIPLVNNAERSWPQRVLVRTYWKFLEPEYETNLTEATRRAMLKVLTARMRNLAATDVVPYGEQRLLTHMLQAAFSRYAGQQEDVPEFAQLLRTLQVYAGKPRKDDVLAVSIGGWLGMNQGQRPEMETVRDMLVAMGHWDRLVRHQAAAAMANKIRKDANLADAVFEMFDDPRDEVRAAAASVFSYLMGFQAGKVVPRMAQLLLYDRGVIVQQAASDALISYADDAGQTVSTLLDGLVERKPLPGPKRTASIFQTLTYLVHPRMPEKQKDRLLALAVENLTFSPEWSLKAMEALGPYARSAVPKILQYYRTKADRMEKQTIRRHVLVSIDPDAIERLD
jgi:hypothetical protein